MKTKQACSFDACNYVRIDANAPNKVVDLHDIFVKRSKFRVFFSYIGQIFLLANILLLPFGKEKLSIGSFWRLFLGVVFAMIFQYKPIKKESVVIMPSFGVQLETHFWSGKIDRKFIPMGKIIKPVLNECVTPITSYWNLALILHDEDQLTLIFQIALRWLLEQGVSILVKSFKMERLRQNLEIFDWELTGEERQKISTIPQQKRGNVELMLTKEGSLNSIDISNLEIIEV